MADDMANRPKSVTPERNPVDLTDGGTMRVNLAQETLRLQHDAGYTDDEMKQEVVFLRSEHLYECARQYWTGKTRGYLAGAADASRQLPIWLPYFAFASGLLLYPFGRFACVWLLPHAWHVIRAAYG